MNFLKNSMKKNTMENHYFCRFGRHEKYKGNKIQRKMLEKYGNIFPNILFTNSSTNKLMRKKIEKKGKVTINVNI